MPVTVPFVPVRPDIPVYMILVYAAFAFSLGLALTPWFIAFLRKNKLGKQLRAQTVDGREPSIFLKYHEKKFGTPTMGGVLIWGSIALTVMFSRAFAYINLVDASLLQRGQVYIPLLVLLSMGILGAIDDYLNVIGNSEAQWQRVLKQARRLSLILGLVFVLACAPLVNDFITGKPLELPAIWSLVLYVLSLSLFGSVVAVFDDWCKRRSSGAPNKKGGITAMAKLLSVLFVAGLVACWFYFKNQYHQIDVPFYGSVDIGFWFIPLAILVIVGTANAVNVTDGLDGLAGGLLIIAFSAFGILAFLQGLYALTAFCAVIVGAVGAFLWHNVPPALFYMGDTGALALGGVLGVIAIMTDHILLLPIAGSVFVIEMLSVIIQLTSKKFRGGKKVFKAAPIHHHFEALEWGESKVTMRMWIIGAFSAFLAIVIGIYG